MVSRGNQMHHIQPDKMKGPRLYICTKNMAAIGRGRGRGRGLLAREAPTESALKPGGLGNGDEKVFTRLEHEIFEFISEISLEFCFVCSKYLSFSVRQ